MALSCRQLNAITSLSSAGSLFRAPPTRTRCSDGTSAGRVTGRPARSGSLSIVDLRDAAVLSHPRHRKAALLGEHITARRAYDQEGLCAVPARRGAPAPETSGPPATTEHPGPDA